MEIREKQELLKSVAIIEQLMNPNGGCPWDLEQTHESILKNLIEEAYEFIDAVERKDVENMQEEIGDLLMQVLLQSEIAKRDEEFDIEDVAKVLNEKLIFRHPHVFNREDGDKNPTTSAEVLGQWEILKEKEKKLKGHKVAATDMPEKLLFAPSLTSAYKIGLKSGKVGFDWENAAQVIYKVEEEWQEVKEELAPRTEDDINRERVEEEIGDLLFSVAQLARHLEVDPERALKKANKKFIHRYQLMEKELQKSGKKLLDLNLDEKELYWNRAKVSAKMEAKK